MTSASQALAMCQDTRVRVSWLRRLRLRQIRFFASLLISLGRRPFGTRLIVRLRSSLLIRRFLQPSLAFRGTFSSFAAAQSAAAKYIPAGHEHPDETCFHLSISGILRESDYPVLFHLAPIAHSVKTVFDLGGNIGNVFYSYQRYLDFSPDLTWIIYDIPGVRSLGEKRAAQRGEARLRFTGNLASGKDADVLLISGSLHYFEQPLDTLLQQIGASPAHVFVNRTPCSLGDDLVTVQDNRSYLVPCKLHSRSQLMQRMQSAGYRLVAEWPVFELGLRVPLYPDISPRAYSGFYFRKE